MDEILSSELREEDDFWISPARCHHEAINVTIIIPSYQAATTLHRAIDSVQKQTIHEIEIIVVDDGSTDSSWHIVSDLLRTEPRLRAMRNKGNRGKSVALNRAVPFAQGRWLAILDADDWYHPERLATLAAQAEKLGADMIADNQFLFDAAAETVVGPAWSMGQTIWKLTFDSYLRGSDAYDNFNLGMLKPIIRTEFVRATGLSYDERARYSEDFIYLLQFFLLNGKAVVSDTPHYFYTQPFGTVSHRSSNAARKRYNFQMAYDINQTYLSKNAGSLTPFQSSNLRARGRRLISLEGYFCTKELLEHGQWGKALIWTVQHPAMLGYAAHRLFNRCITRSTAAATERVARESRYRSRAASDTHK